jgi:hypothetical protein
MTVLTEVICIWLVSAHCIYVYVPGFIVAVESCTHCIESCNYILYMHATQGTHVLVFSLKSYNISRC